MNREKLKVQTPHRASADAGTKILSLAQGADTDELKKKQKKIMKIKGA